MDMNVKPDDLQPEAAPQGTTAPPPEQPAEQPSEERKPHRQTRAKRIGKRLKKPAAEGQKREKGQVAYPWYDLETAIATARAIVEGGGLPMTREQLAGALRIAPAGGNFILKTSAARMFGLIELVQSKFQLTQLGYLVLGKDEAKAKAARSEAFLSVPLYRRVYDEFRGKPLPPRPVGLETAFVQFGVPTKSRKIARQVFERSARQGGFFNVDPDRLIEPIIGPAGSAEQQPMETTPEPSSRPSTGGNSQATPAVSFELDELIRGMLRRLPKSDETWTAERKAKWLRTLSQNLDYVYELEDDKFVVIEVKAHASN